MKPIKLIELLTANEIRNISTNSFIVLHNRFIWLSVSDIIRVSDAMNNASGLNKTFEENFCELVRRHRLLEEI